MLTDITQSQEARCGDVQDYESSHKQHEVYKYRIRDKDIIKVLKQALEGVDVDILIINHGKPIHTRTHTFYIYYMHLNFCFHLI